MDNEFEIPRLPCVLDVHLISTPFVIISGEQGS